MKRHFSNCFDSLKYSAKVPVDVMRMTMTKSGYNSARYDYADAKTALNKTVILAPFAGKITKRKPAYLIDKLIIN